MIAYIIENGYNITIPNFKRKDGDKMKTYDFDNITIHGAKDKDQARKMAEDLLEAAAEAGYVKEKTEAQKKSLPSE